MSLDGYDLDQAYEINGPEAARQMYGDWAETYDESFGRAWGYIAPREIAAILKGHADPMGEILDIGAGTGLVAEHLRGLTVDALDITPEMLDVARARWLVAPANAIPVVQEQVRRQGGYVSHRPCGEGVALGIEYFLERA